jgi:hypothetical protein
MIRSFESNAWIRNLLHQFKRKSVKFQGIGQKNGRNSVEPCNRNYIRDTDDNDDNFLFVPVVQSAGWWDIHFTVGTSYERAAPLAEKNAALGLSDFSVSGDARRHPISLRSEHSVYSRY